MAKNIVEENVVETENLPIEGTPMCEIVKEGEEYFLVDNGVKSEPLKTEATGVAFVLPVNSSNRKWYNKGRVDAAIESEGKLVLTYKATRKIGSTGSTGVRMPNAKLVETYLSPEEFAEYKAIIDRAIAARDAAKAKPMTEKEKLEAKIAKAQAALDKLLEEAAD